jgi:acetolactate synthase I/II/III large subunit
MNGSEILVKTLERNGVEVIFGVPGDIENYFFKALSSSKINFITVRHEQSAAFMADAYYRLTGKIGVCFSTLGPGATNLLTGIASAWQERSSVIAISGQLSQNKHFQDSHQYVDLKNLFKSCTKESFLVKRVTDIQATFSKAIFEATTEKTGPVHVSVPVNLFEQEADFQINSLKQNIEYEYRDSVINCVKEIAKAQNTVIIIGSSCARSNALEEIDSFIEKTNCPIYTTFLGKGVVAHTKQNFCGVLSRHSKKIKQILSQQDLIINIGFDVVEGITPEIWKGAKKVIHVDSSPPTGGGIYNPDLEVIGPIKQTLSSITGKISQNNICFDYNNYKVDYDIPELSFPYHPASVPNILSEKIKDCIVIPDVGMHKQYVGFYYNASSPNEVLFSNGFSSMGFSFPAALGSKIASPDKNVISVTGDGGFQMNIQELATAVENNIGVLVIVMNDNCLGMVKLRQTENTASVYGAEYKFETDFAAISRAYGGLGLKLKDHHDLEKEILNALKLVNEKKLPFVLDVPIMQYTEIESIK